MSMNNATLIDTLIGEVEFGKIQKLLGTEIYNAIVAEVSSGDISTDLQAILDEGLYKCIAYFVYARYVQESMLQDTFTGIVTKQRSDSQIASTGQIKNVVNEYVDMAMMAYSLVKDKIIAKYNNKPSEAAHSEFSEIIGIRRNPRHKGSKIIYM